DLLRPLLQCDEVEDVMVPVVERGLDFDLGPVVVAVQSFALVAGERDEVAAGEDEVVLRDADGEAVGHGQSQSGTSQRNGADGATLFSRRAMNRQAVTRSAVV